MTREGYLATACAVINFSFSFIFGHILASLYICHRIAFMFQIVSLRFSFDNTLYSSIVCSCCISISSWHSRLYRRKKYWLWLADWLCNISHFSWHDISLQVVLPSSSTLTDLSVNIIDPWGRPTVTVGSDHCFHTCRPFVCNHFSKQCSLQARLWVWPSGSLLASIYVLTLRFLFKLCLRQILFTFCIMLGRMSLLGSNRFLLLFCEPATATGVMSNDSLRWLRFSSSIIGDRSWQMILERGIWWGPPCSTSPSLDLRKTRIRLSLYIFWNKKSDTNFFSILYS